MSPRTPHSQNNIRDQWAAQHTRPNTGEDSPRWSDEIVDDEGYDGLSDGEEPGLSHRATSEMTQTSARSAGSSSAGGSKRTRPLSTQLVPRAGARSRKSEESQVSYGSRFTTDSETKRGAATRRGKGAAGDSSRRDAGAGVSSGKSDGRTTKKSAAKSNGKKSGGSASLSVDNAPSLSTAGISAEPGSVPNGGLSEAMGLENVRVTSREVPRQVRRDSRWTSEESFPVDMLEEETTSTTQPKRENSGASPLASLRGFFGRRLSKEKEPGEIAGSSSEANIFEGFAPSEASPTVDPFSEESVDISLRESQTSQAKDASQGALARLSGLVSSLGEKVTSLFPRSAEASDGARGTSQVPHERVSQGGPASGSTFHTTMGADSGAHFSSWMADSASVAQRGLASIDDMELANLRNAVRQDAQGVSYSRYDGDKYKNRRMVFSDFLDDAYDRCGMSTTKYYIFYTLISIIVILIFISASHAILNKSIMSNPIAFNIALALLVVSIVVGLALAGYHAYRDIKRQADDVFVILSWSMGRVAIAILLILLAWVLAMAGASS